MDTRAGRLSLYNSDFRYTDPAGTYSTALQTWAELEFPAGEPVTVNGFARARGGAQLRSYRWTRDSADLFDETPSLDEVTDLTRWSQPRRRPKNHDADEWDLAGARAGGRTQTI